MCRPSEMLMDAPRGLSDSLFNLRRAPLSDMKLPVATTSAFLLCLAATMAIVVVASPVRRRHELAPEEVERANVEIEAMPQLRELYDSFQIRDNVDGQITSLQDKVYAKLVKRVNKAQRKYLKALYRARVAMSIAPPINFHILLKSTFERAMAIDRLVPVLEERGYQVSFVSGRGDAGCFGACLATILHRDSSEQPWLLVMTPVFPASNNDAMIEGEDVLAVNEEDERGDVHAANVEGDEEEHVPEANAEGNEEEHALAANAEHGEEETAEDVLIRRAIDEIQAEEATKGVPARADRANDEFNSPLHDDVNMYDAENNSYGAITEDDYEQVPEHRVDSVDTRDTTDDAYNAIEEYPLDDNIHGAGMSVKEVRAPHTRSRHVPGWEAYDY